MAHFNSSMSAAARVIAAQTFEEEAPATERNVHDVHERDTLVPGAPESNRATTSEQEVVRGSLRWALGITEANVVRNRETMSATQAVFMACDWAERKLVAQITTESDRRTFGDWLRQRRQSAHPTLNEQRVRELWEQRKAQLLRSDPTPSETEAARQAVGFVLGVVKRDTRLNDDERQKLIRAALALRPREYITLERIQDRLAEADPSEVREGVMHYLDQRRAWEPGKEEAIREYLYSVTQTHFTRGCGSVVEIEYAIEGARAWFDSHAGRRGKRSEERTPYRQQEVALPRETPALKVVNPDTLPASESEARAKEKKQKRIAKAAEQQRRREDPNFGAQKRTAHSGDEGKKNKQGKKGKKQPQDS